MCFAMGSRTRKCELLTQRSAICFAISPLLCDVYEQKFGLKSGSCHR